MSDIPEHTPSPTKTYRLFVKRKIKLVIKKDVISWIHKYAPKNVDSLYCNKLAVSKILNLISIIILSSKNVVVSIIFILVYFSIKFYLQIIIKINSKIKKLIIYQLYL